MTRNGLPALSALAIITLPAQAGLVAHFDFEEGSGTSTTSAVGGWTGPFSGDPQWVTTGLAPVPSGTTAALAFDGDGDLIISNFAGIAGNGARTVSFWVSTNTITNSGIVAWGNAASNGTKWHVRLNDNAVNGTLGAIRSEIQGSFEIDGPTMLDGIWHHVASVYSAGGAFGSGQVLHYIDGVLVGQDDLQAQTGGDAVLVNTSTSSTVSGNIYPVVLGGRHQAGLASFNGIIDEVRIYDTALSASEVQALYIPEPSSLLLCGLSLGLGLASRRR